MLENINDMHVPQKFRHLFWYDCAYCHREVRDAEWGRKLRASRTCPHCKTALAVETRYQGKPGAWVEFFQWVEGYEWSEASRESAMLKRIAARQGVVDG